MRHYLQLKKWHAIPLAVSSLLVCYSTNSFAYSPALSGMYFSVGAGIAGSHVKLTKIAPGTPAQFFLSGSQNMSDSDLLLNAAIGHDFYDYGEGLPIRTELAYNHFGSFSTDKYTTQNVGNVLRHFNYQSEAYMWENYWDFHGVSQSVVPFVGVGIGVAENEGSTMHSGNEAANLTKSEFAWNVLAGLNVDMNSNVKLGAVVRYTDLGKINFGQVNGPSAGFPTRGTVAEVSGDLHTVDAMVTLSYQFA